MTVDEVRAERVRFDSATIFTAHTEDVDELAFCRRVLIEIASMKAEYPGDAIIMRALARAAIGADDETS